MPREELAEYHWPQNVLIGSLVVKFNPVEQQEEHKISGDKNTMLIFEITWDHFANTDKATAIYDINDVIEAGVAEYTPTNKDGIVIAHNHNHVVANFNMDGTYYVQHGHVTNVWTRPRGPQEPMVARCGKARVRFVA